MQNWILTDDDSYQHIRKRDCATFEVIDTCSIGDDRYAVLLGSIALDEHNLDDPTFIDEYLKPFGYLSMSELRALYGEAASQIAAECIFETKPFSCGEVVCEGTFNECSAHIAAFVQEDKA